MQYRELGQNHHLSGDRYATSMSLFKKFLYKAQVGSTAQELASEDMLEKDIRYLGKQELTALPIPGAKTRDRRKLPYGYRKKVFHVHHNGIDFPLFQSMVLGFFG